MNKKHVISKWAKTFVIVLLGAGLATFTACDDDPITDPTNPVNPGGNGGSSTSGDSWAYLLNETPQDYHVDGNTMTYGSHTYTLEGAFDFNATIHNEATAWVSFTNIPSGYTEFKAVYENFLGLSPEGATAMIPMAMEIYARDANVGKQCFYLLCTNTSTADGIIRILKTKFNYSPYSPEGDQYIQRYLPAATLKGAVNTNAYAPTEPYTVEMCTCSNTIQESELSGGYVYYAYILANGWDTFQRNVDIFRGWESNLYKVHNCPATYTQCKPIHGTWQGLK